MRKLIKGIVDFHENLLPSYRETFAKLALGQSPDSLFVACSDSRVVPNLFASTDPGDLFVIRNVGNLIPPCEPRAVVPYDQSIAAALEFSIEQLKISDIIICGHSHCGAARALLNENQFQSPSLKQWLQHAIPSLRRLQSGEIVNPDLTIEDQLSQINVLQQIDHLCTYPLVQKAVMEDRLRLHAWWFEIGQAEVYGYRPEQSQFIRIDRAQAERLLMELGETNGVNDLKPSVPWQMTRSSPSDQAKDHRSCDDQSGKNPPETNQKKDS